MEDYQPDSNDVQQNKGMAMVAYILFFIPLLAAKDSKFAMYHANQGLSLFIVAVGCNLVLGVIPIIGWLLLPIAYLLIFVLVILGIVNASNGAAKALPVIGKYTLLK